MVNYIKTQIQQIKERLPEQPMFSRKGLSVCASCHQVVGDQKESNPKQLKSQIAKGADDVDAKELLYADNIKKGPSGRDLQDKDKNRVSPNNKNK